MKKKLYYSLAALASMAMASCSQDNLGGGANVPAGEEATVTLAVSVPVGIESRAFSDGTTATTLQWALYDITGDAFTQMKAVNDDTIELRKQMTLQLVSGHTYGVVFFAHQAEAPYTVTMDATGAKVEVDYSGVSANDEALDAFYAYETFQVTGDTQLDVKLYRPFAQINVGTNDYDDAAALRYEPEQSALSVTGVYTELDLLTGNVSGTTEDVDFAFSEIPATETFPVAHYDYIAMAYVLVPADQQLVEVTFKYKDDTEAEAAAKTRTVTNVPVRRNYRTNIYGQILTSNVAPTVHIEPAYNEPDYDVTGLRLAAAIGGTVTLDDDIELDAELEVRAALTVDLNGHEIVFADNREDGDERAAFYVTGDGDLTFTGNGTVKTTGTGTYPVWVNGGANVTVENGTFINEQGPDAIYIGKGSCYIKGGWFESQRWNGINYTLNCNDTNYRNGTAFFVVTGGTFVDFDPMNSEADTKDGVNANWLPEGYMESQTGINGKKVYMVYPEDVALVGSIYEIGRALTEGKTSLKFLPGEYYITWWEETAEGVRFYDSGNQRFWTGLTEAYKLDFTGATILGQVSPNFHGATVIGATFDKGSAEQAVMGSFIGNFIDCAFTGGVYAENGTGKGYFKGCRFYNEGDGATDKMAFHNGDIAEGNTMILDNCTVDGRCDFGVNGTLVFNNCTLNVRGEEWGVYGTGTVKFVNCNVTNPEKIVSKQGATIEGL